MTTNLPTRLRNQADKLQAKIDHKRDTFSSANFTHRRARMQASVRQDADHLEKVQYALRGLADAHDNGSLPSLLASVKTKVLIDHLLTFRTWPDGHWGEADRKRLLKASITEPFYTEAREALIALASPPDRRAENELAELERKARSLVGQIPGFFPTPDLVIDQMLALINLTENDHVLEPQAGAGHIARRVREITEHLTVCEQHFTLRKLLKGQGFNLVDASDFFNLEMYGQFDAVIQNPPFERGQDMDHVRHAYLHLKPRGRMVSVVSESVHFRRDAKYADFRLWLEDQGGYFVGLPEYAFRSSGTGVQARLVVLHKEQS